jgi:nicotinamide mononucleotide transporter
VFLEWAFCLHLFCLSFLEIIAFIAGIVYLIGIGKSRRWGWWFGGINAGIYVYLCLELALYVQTVLQFIYVLLAFVGYWNWGRAEVHQVKKRNLAFHLAAIASCSILALSIGFTLEHFTDQALPIQDAFIGVFALFATVLTILHILENWYYWLLINLASVYLFSLQELYITAGLFLVNFAMSVWGLYAWKTNKNA